MTRIILLFLTFFGFARAAPTVWVVDDAVKLKRGQLNHPQESGVGNPVWSPGEAVRLHALKDEVVAFQVVVEADGQGLQGVTVELAELTGPAGARIANDAGSDDPARWSGRRIERFVEHFFQIDRISGGPWGSIHWRDGAGPGDEYVGWVPDALIPVEWAPDWAPYPMVVPANQNRIIWIDVWVPPDQAAGEYAGRLVVRAGDAELADIPVALTVANVTLPAWPVKTALYAEHGQISSRMGDGAFAPTLKHLHQLLHRHRINTMHHVTDLAGARAILPALTGALFTAAEGYAGPAVGVAAETLSIGTYGSLGVPDANKMRVVESIADLLVDSGVLPGEVSAFVYVIDESCGHAWGQQWMNLYDASNNPNVRHLRIGWTCSGAAANQVVNLVMKGAPEYDPAEDDDLDKEIWIYNGTRGMTGSFSTDVDAIDLRVNGWIAGLYGVPRWFYWNSTFWTDSNAGGFGAFDVFVEPETFHNQFNEYAVGDGVLLYPGRQEQFPNHSIGQSGVLASIRLKNWRRGIQDAGYLELARRQDSEAADAVAAEILGGVLRQWQGGNPVNWARSSLEWDAARAALRAVIGGEEPPPPPPPPPPPRRLTWRRWPSLEPRRRW